MDPIRDDDAEADIDALLAEVIAHGAPAHRRLAQELAAQLSDGAAAQDLRKDVIRLADAYRNDPYLWR